MSGDGERGEEAGMVDILWRSESLGSSELCRLAEIPGGWRLSGLVLAAVDGRPIHVVYEVDVDERWRTRSVRGSLFSAGETRSLALRADGEGHWEAGAEPVTELDGCLDVDLELSPSTNTLPIRRLGLEVGAHAELAAAWIRFPSLALERLEQSYERLTERRWRYASGSFEAELGVDGSGLVVAYGDIWRAVGHSDPAELGPSPQSGGASSQGGGTESR